MDSETGSLVENAVRTEARGTIKYKGFTRPVHVHAVAGLYDDPDVQRRVITYDRDGVPLADRPRSARPRGEGRSDRGAKRSDRQARRLKLSPLPTALDFWHLADISAHPADVRY